MKNQMDGACNTYGREERCIQVLVGKTGEGDHLEHKVGDEKYY
jgi:hypothetical protein